VSTKCPRQKILRLYKNTLFKVTQANLQAY